MRLRAAAATQVWLRDLRSLFLSHIDLADDRSVLVDDRYCSDGISPSQLSGRSQIPL